MSSFPSPSLFANPFLGQATYKRKEEKGVSFHFVSLQGGFSNPGGSLTPDTPPPPHPPQRYSVSLWVFGNVPQIIRIFFGLAIQSKRVFADSLLGMNNT